VVEPDVIGTEDRPARRRHGWVLPAVVLIALGLAAIAIKAKEAGNGAGPAPPASSPAGNRPPPTRPPPTQPTSYPTATGQSNDFDVVEQGGPCVAIELGGHRLTYLFGIENVGPQPLEVLSVSRRAAGLALLAIELPTGCDTGRAAPPFTPFRLAPGVSRLVRLRYRITDCAAASSSNRTLVTVTTGQIVDGSVRRSRIGVLEEPHPCR